LEPPLTAPDSALRMIEKGSGEPFWLLFSSTAARNGFWPVLLLEAELLSAEELSLVPLVESAEDE